MAVPNSLGPKYRWLQRHFPFIPPTHYVFCGNKSILRADFLIDDQPRNLLRFEGQGLLYSAPHNIMAEGFVRVNNWVEVAQFFAGIPAAADAAARPHPLARNSDMQGWWVILRETIPQGLKPRGFSSTCGTTEVVPFQNSFELTHYPPTTVP